LFSIYSSQELQPRFFLFQVYKKNSKFAPKKLSKLVEFALEKHTSKVGLKGGSKATLPSPLHCHQKKKKKKKKLTKIYKAWFFFLLPCPAQPSPEPSQKGLGVSAKAGSSPSPLSWEERPSDKYDKRLYKS